MRYNFLCTVRTFLLQMLCTSVLHRLCRLCLAVFVATVSACFLKCNAGAACNVNNRIGVLFNGKPQLRADVICHEKICGDCKYLCVFRNCRGKQIGNNDNNPRCTASDGRHILPYKICTGLGIIRCGTYRNNSSIMESCAFSW